MKVWLFRAIALCIPVLFFVILEVALRIGGFGAEFPLFIENPANKNYILPRPDLVKRYFAEGAAIPSVTMEANFLLKDKPENGLRFFVQGGSSAAGFPYGLGASLAGMLDQRLKMTFPNKHVEVVNTAMAAVNSYTLLDLADEIIDQQPDAVLIYAGHNEYLGILGVGSNYTAANSQGTTLLFLKLKELRLFQLIQQIYQLFQSSPEPKEQTADGKTSRTFMAKVAKHKNIQLGDEIYLTGQNQFRTNLGLLIKKYREAHVPVFVATIASNLADQKPFSSPEISEENKSRLANLEAFNHKSPQNGEFSRQLAELHTLAKDSDNAMLNFRVARVHLAANKSEKALELFIRARDLDQLRFRAPSDTNSVIRDLAAQQHAILVDVEKRLTERSPNGIIGNNFMLEHLHLNVQGYFLLADTFYQALKQHTQFGEWRNVPTQSAWKMRPILPSEEFHGFAKVQQLMADYPFTDSPSTPKIPRPQGWEQSLGKQFFDKKIDWLGVMRQSLRHYQAEKRTELANKTLLLMAEALPHDPRINLAIAKGYEQGKEQGLAATYYKRAILAGDKQPSTYQALIRSLEATGQKQLAQRWKQERDAL